MRTVFDDIIYADYHQAYVHLQDTYDITEDVFAGQANGLLGATYPTLLFLTLGRNAGDIHMTVKIADHAPPIDDSWEEIVEASFTMPKGSELGLADWDGNIWCPVPLAPGSYRARYSAVNFGEADATDEDDEGQPIEQYELIFWPAALSNDRILKVTRAAAMYWHDVAQGKASSTCCDSSGASGAAPVPVVAQAIAQSQIKLLAGAQEDGVSYADGTGTAARFGTLRGITVDALGNVYVSDYGNKAIRKIAPTGASSTVAGHWRGATSCPGAGARLEAPGGVVVDADGSLLVADGSTIRRVTPGGDVETIAGHARTEGVLPRPDRLQYLARGPEGQLYAADNSVVYKVTGGEFICLRRVLQHPQVW